MIAGFILSASSVYLNKIVYADDPWSDIQSRQQAAEQKALLVYGTKYQANNLNGSERNWSGLTNTPTDETSRGRNIDAAAQISLDNAMATFDEIHIKQLAALQSNYTGLTNTPTDTQGRDRNALIAQGRDAVEMQTAQILGNLTQLQQSYIDFQQGPTTDSQGRNRQAMIEQNQMDMENQARDLVSSLAKINGVYVDLEANPQVTPAFVYYPGSTTDEKGPGRPLSASEAYALSKGIMIFNEIHARNLMDYQSNYYGLTNTPTDTTGRDRTAMLQEAQQTSLANAMRVYDAYYGGVGLK